MNFLKLYYLAFNNKGEVKNCGRNVCKELIKAAYKINNTTDYGNPETGFMNIENIKILYEEILNSLDE